MAMTEEQKAERRAARAEQRRLAEMLHIEERAVQAEAVASRRQARYEQYERDGLLPTRESLQAGGPPCPGCGKPYIDGAGSWPPQMQLTPDELAAQQAMETEFKQTHAACDKQFGIRGWSYEGSRTRHCWECCPHPPLSDSQISTLRRLLLPTQDDTWRQANLNVWRITLRCGHSLERTVNKDRKDYPPNRYTATKCPACEEYRAEASTALLGPLAEQSTNAVKTPAQSKAEINRERRKLRELQRQVTESQNRLALLEQRQTQP